MSEKKLIDFGTHRKKCDNFRIEPCQGFAPRYMCKLNPCRCTPDNCEEWNKLPLPTLKNIQGERTLESMTREEIEELAKIAGLNPDRMKILETFPLSKGIERIKLIYLFSGCDGDSKAPCWIEMGQFLIPNSSRNPSSVFKWFLEKGFKVF